jgi:hypothetical protein
LRTGYVCGFRLFWLGQICFLAGTVQSRAPLAPAAQGADAGFPPHLAARRLQQHTPNGWVGQCLTQAVEPSRALIAQDRGLLPEHSIVYAETGRFGGWPANHGIWSRGDERLVGFSAGYHKGNERHNIDREKPEEHLFARSMDGGATWRVEHPAGNGGPIAAGKALHGVANPDLQEKPWKELMEAIQFDATIWPAVMSNR